MNTRDADILRRHDAGEFHQSIGNSYGISRERVRQIVKRYAKEARRVTIDKRNAEIADALNADWMTTAEAGERFGVSPCVVRKAAKDNGIQMPVRSFADEMELKFLAAKVRAGESINGAAGGDHSLHAKLWYYCQAHGIKSSAPCRWTTSPMRAELLLQWRTEGLTWKRCAERLASVEGTRPVLGTALSNWCARNAPDAFAIKVGRGGPKAPKTPKTRQPSRPPPQQRQDQYPSITVAATVRETALINKGKASASQIARAIGVSRNSIIGHWFRARQFVGAA